MPVTTYHYEWLLQASWASLYYVGSDTRGSVCGLVGKIERKNVVTPISTRIRRIIHSYFQRVRMVSR